MALKISMSHTLDSCYNVCGNAGRWPVQGAKDWKGLKVKQKQKLSEIMFGVICNYYREYGRMPAEAALKRLTN